MKWMLIWLFVVFSANLSLTQTSRGDVSAKTRPDLNGIWALDMSQSDLGSSKRDLLYVDIRLVILQREPELKIIRTLVKNKKEHAQELIYYSDGRGEVNPGIASKDVVKSKTRWDGALLISDSVHSDVYFTFETTDKWEISDDRKTLMYSMSSTPPQSRFGTPTIVRDYARTIRRVFKRVP